MLGELSCIIMPLKIIIIIIMVRSSQDDILAVVRVPRNWSPGLRPLEYDVTLSGHYNVFIFIIVLTKKC